VQDGLRHDSHLVVAIRAAENIGVFMYISTCMYMKTKNPVAQSRATTTGLFLIGVAGFYLCKYPLSNW
jgi:hypothetical protein